MRRNQKERTLESWLHHLPEAYAYHQILTDEEGTPVDYVFIHVNPAFEAMTGLMKEAILGKRVREVLPEIQQGQFDWISTYGRVALSGEKAEIQAYSKPLDRWYSICAYSHEPGYFAVLFHDITQQQREKQMMKAMLRSNHRFLEKEGTVEVEELAKEMKNLTGARMVLFNEFDKTTGEFITKAMAGDPEPLKKAVEIVGVQLVGKSWRPDPERQAKIKQTSLVILEGLGDLVRNNLSSQMVRLLEKTLDIGTTALVNITKKESFLGHFALLMPRGYPLENQELITLYATQVGMHLDREKSQQALKTEQRRLSNIIEATNVGIWERNIQTKELVVNHRWAAIMGYELSELEPITLSTWKDLIHPEDFKKIENEVMRAYHRTKTYCDVECRMKHKQNHWVWVHIRGKILTWTEDGKPLLMSGAISDITDRKQSEAALQQAKQQAESANQAKSRYLAHMNHEIRTPLSGFIGFIQLMEETRLEEERQEFMHYMKQSADHLLSIVNNVLDYAQIEAGEMQLDHQRFFLEEEIKAAIAPLHSLALRENIGLQVIGIEDLPQKVVGDPQRLRQIILNLAGNALKFTESGRVILTVKTVENQETQYILDLVVEDTGPGMTEETLKNLFKPFYQADDGSIRQTKGTGLGMPITWELVNLMGGKIRVESSLGKGTRVEVRLMLEKDPSTLHSSSLEMEVSKNTGLET